MMTLRPTPSTRDVVREQVRIVGLMLRLQALMIAVVLGIITVIIVADIVRGRAETWFDSREWSPIGLVAFLAPFAVWWRERRFGAAFLWTLPVDRRRLALTRVFAGWLWLMVALTGFVVWQRGLALLSGVTHAKTTSLFAFIGATALYLLGSAFVLGLRHPLRWLLAAGGVFFLLGTLNQSLGDGPDGRVDKFLSSSGFFSAVQHAAEAWSALPVLAQSFFLLAAGLAALWAAVSRHGERRRH